MAEKGNLSEKGRSRVYHTAGTRVSMGGRGMAHAEHGGAIIILHRQPLLARRRQPPKAGCKPLQSPICTQSVTASGLLWALHPASLVGAPSFFTRRRSILLHCETPQSSYAEQQALERQPESAWVYDLIGQVLPYEIRNITRDSPLSP